MKNQDYFNELFIKNKNKKSDEDEDDFSSVAISNKPKVVNNVTIHLHGAIGPLEKYAEFFHCMRSLEEGDTAYVFLNSPGGYLVTAHEIIQSMRDCEGDVVVICTGECSSAGSMIALAANNLHVGPYASMLVHHASYGAAGKASDVAKKVSYSEKELRRVMNEFYEGFMTQKEIEDVLEGKDYWFDSEEITRRLLARQEYLKNKENQVKEEKPKVVKRKPKVSLD